MGFNADQLQKSEKAELAGGIDIVECIKAHQHVGPVAHGLSSAKIRFRALGLTWPSDAVA